MGIRDLIKAIRENGSYEIETVNLSNYYGTLVAIDASIYLHRFNFMKTNYLLSFMMQIYNLLKNGIIPIYVFDDEPPASKGETLKTRKLRREAIDKKIVAAEGNSELKAKLEKQRIMIDRDSEINIIRMLDMLNMPWVKVAHCEAEAVCAILAIKHYVSAVMTEDTDILAYGCPVWLRGFKNNSKKVECIELEDVLDSLDLTKRQFVDYCILLGTDHNNRVYGPKTAYEKIKEYKSLGHIVEKDKYRELKEVREIFTSKYLECLNGIEGSINLGYKHLIRKVKSAISSDSTMTALSKFVGSFRAEDESRVQVMVAKFKKELKP